MFSPLLLRSPPVMRALWSRRPYWDRKRLRVGPLWGPTRPECAHRPAGAPGTRTNEMDFARMSEARLPIRRNPAFSFRAILAGVFALAITGLAGCSSNDDEIP